MKLTHSTAPVVLITGCSSGIGLSLAQMFRAQQIFRVVITARRKSIEKLRSQFQESERFLIRELDITDDNQMNALVNEITIRWDGIDILINNAGIAYRSVIEQMNEHEELHQLKTNYLGPMALIRLILPTMREKGFGHIINISSVSGVMAMPTMGSYSASKHALEAATEALWYEMKPFGIQVSLVQPGFVHSDSYKNVYLSEKAKFTEKLGGPYADVYQFITPFIEKLMNLSPTTPEKIANKVLSICIHHNPKLWESATWDAVMFTVLKKILPRYLFHRIMFRFLPKSKAWGGNFKNQKAS